MRTRREFLNTCGTLTLATLSGFHAHAQGQPSTLRIAFFGLQPAALIRDMEREYRIQRLHSHERRDLRNNTAEVIGFEQLPQADVWVGAGNKHVRLSDAQRRILRDFVAAGKPFVGLRAAHHAFERGDDWRIDRDVFGVTFVGHHLLGRERELRVELTDGAGQHEILCGLNPPAPISGSYVHRDPAADVRVLLRAGLPNDMQPHTWVREIPRTRNRVFYTRYDSSQLEREQIVRQMFIRGLLWALNCDMARYRRA